MATPISPESRSGTAINPLPPAPKQELPKVDVQMCVTCEECGIVAAGIPDEEDAMSKAKKHWERHKSGDLAKKESTKHG